MTRGRALAVATLAVAWAWLWAGATLTAAPPAVKNRGVKAAVAPRQAKGASVEKAIAALKREYALYEKDPAGAPLRSVPDYFADNPQPVDADALLGALEKPLAGNARQTAYVKWQLLSGLPETLDDAGVRRLLKAYQKAPMPAPRYGSSPQEKRTLDALLLRARPQDDVQITAKLEQAVERSHEADRPVIAYRDELYRRLPPGRDKFFAGLEDAHERMSVAAPTSDLMDLIVDDLQAWALAGNASKAQVREVAELVGRLRLVEGPPYYASAAVRRGRLGWVVKTDPLLTKKKFAALHKLLLDAADGA